MSVAATQQSRELGATPAADVSAPSNLASQHALSPQQKQAVSLLSSGVSQTQVAAALGISDGLVSQWMADETFAAQVQLATIAVTENEQRFDTLLEDAEMKALDNIKQRLPLANLQQSLAAFSVLNKAQTRRSRNPASGIAQNRAPIVQIVLPTQMAVQYIKNTQAEIVEVEGQTLVSAPQAMLPTLLKERLNRVLPQLSIEHKVERADEALASLAAPAKRKPVKLIPGIGSPEDL